MALLKRICRGVIVAALLVPAPIHAQNEQRVDVTTQSTQRLEGPSSEDLVITLRLAPDVQPETLELLNRMTKPRVVQLRSTENAGYLLSRVYGASLSSVEARLRTLNPWIGASDLTTLTTAETTSIKLAAGAEYYANVIKPVSAGTGLEQQAVLETGASSKYLLRQIKKTSDSFKNFFSDYCKTHRCTAAQAEAYRSQKPLAFPYVSRYVSFTLTPDARKSPTALLEALKRDPAVSEPEIHTPAKLIFPVIRSFTELSTVHTCAADPSDADWFVRAVSLHKLPIDALRGSNESIIAVMDSGIALDDKRFLLWQNLAETTGVEKQDDDQNGYTDDTVGCNFIIQSDFPVDDQFSIEYRSHGTHVAGLASGRFLPEPLATAVAQRVQPMILKIADSNGFVDNGAVNDAIVYAQNKGAIVVNMSFEGEYSASIKRYIEQDPGRIYVVAAGNGDQQHRGLNLDLPEVRRFPAKLGQQLNNVIAVAAHNEDGSLACFSNFGKKTVDIAAPGVAVQSTVTEGEFAKFSGTSQATPLVALAAALLHSQGLIQPAAIKQRLLVSVDFQPGYRGRVSSEGKLNIAKAATIYDDVIELKDPEQPLLRGRVLSPPQEITLNGKTIPFRSIRKIVNFTDDNGQATQRITWLDNGKLEHEYGTSSFKGLTIKVGETCLDLTVDVIRDFIPASKPIGQPLPCGGN